MKKISLIFVSMFILYNHSFSQEYIIIRHIGIKDTHIPNLLIKNGTIDRKILDSNSANYKNLFSGIIELDSNKYQMFKKLIYKKKFFDKKIKNLLLGTFEIVIWKKGQKKTFYISNLRSRDFFSLLVTEVKKNDFGDELTLNLKQILRILS